MSTPQLLWSAALACAIATSACSRAETDANADRIAREARNAAVDAKAAAARAGEQLADTWITTKIQAQYFADNDVKARYVNVSTRDGVVTLKGRVDSDNAREQALQIAKNTDGVRTVQDHLMVGPATTATGSEQIDAAWITTKIQARYFSEPDVNGRDLDVSTVNGVVTLSGQLDTEQQKALALSIARTTDGVTRVEDRIVVQPTGVATSGTASAPTRPVPMVDDARVASTIQSRYFMDDMVKGRRIQVDARQGVVTLRGEVGNEAERAQALLLARTAEGVNRVEDNLTVNAAVAAANIDATARGGVSTAPSATARPPATAAGEDETLATRIQAKFFTDPQVRSGSVEVTAKDGVVLLQGNISNEAARKQALTIARNTPGVVQVVDRLKVGKGRK
jgi:hyperosmotically inducible protein